MEGAARVILREDDDGGKPKLYWISHQTQLLRCAPQHVRPDYRQAADTNIGGLEEARREVQSLKSRGITRFIDLQRANKRQIEEIQADEEEFNEDDGPLEQPQQRPRLSVSPLVDEPMVTATRLPEDLDDLDLDIESPSIAPSPVAVVDLEGLELPPAAPDDQVAPLANTEATGPPAEPRAEDIPNP